MLASVFLVPPSSQSCSATSEPSISSEMGFQVTKRSLNFFSFFSALRIFFLSDRDSFASCTGAASAFLPEKQGSSLGTEMIGSCCCLRTGGSFGFCGTGASGTRTSDLNSFWATFVTARLFLWIPSDGTWGPFCKSLAGGCWTLCVILTGWGSNLPIVLEGEGSTLPKTFGGSSSDLPAGAFTDNSTGCVTFTAGWETNLCIGFAGGSVITRFCTVWCAAADLTFTSLWCWTESCLLNREPDPVCWIDGCSRTLGETNTAWESWLLLNLMRTMFPVKSKVAMNKILKQ